MIKILKIALPIPVDKLFDYYAETEEERILTGCRALVPLGKRIVTGYITDSAPGEKSNSIKPVIEILDDIPVFNSKMLELTRWIANYYMCSWGEALRAALPQGMSPKSVLKVELLKWYTDDEIDAMAVRAPKRSALLKAIKEKGAFITVNYLEGILKTDTVSAQIDSLVNAGIIRCERVLDKQNTPKTLKAVQINEDLLSDENGIRDIVSQLEKRAPKQSILFSHVYLEQNEHGKPVILADAIKDTRTDYAVAGALVKRGLFIESTVEIDRSKADENEKRFKPKDEIELSLTEEQRAVLEKILSGIDSKESKPFLLHGITGSGKTLIYMHVIRRVLNNEKNALLLVPEISLTPQLIDRFRHAFGDNISVLHSRMSRGERYDAWRAAATGRSRIVIGARSAVFAPLSNLGIIIVDEEHETGYKQDSPAPRYHARDIAVVRARIDACPVMLGSATPSFESMYNARNDKYELLEIKERADGAKLPEIEVIDMKQERKKRKIHGSFSGELIKSVIKRIEKKEGVILFQNRRGFSTYLECLDCGHVPMCRHCSVSLTYHKSTDKLRCHYCGYTVNRYRECPECGGTDIKEIGSGTQRIEDELKEILQSYNVEAVVERMDLDTTSRKGSHRKILQNFADGKTDILIGTQMVAKGLDFDRVTLVGVINADLQLFMPDFRSSERAFQLLTQVSGRSGRSGSRPGKVIIQTSHPANQSIIAAVNHNYDSFYREELINRKGAFYPPLTRFISIEVSGKNEKNVRELAGILSSLLPDANNAFIKMGPVPPAVFKIKDYFRQLIIIKDLKEKDPSGRKFRYYLSAALGKFRKLNGSASVKVSVDVDSYSGL